MKLLAIFGLILAISGICLGIGLPQLAGIVNDEILQVIDKIHKTYYPQGFAEINALVLASGTGCNYQDYASKFTQWTSDAGLPQSVNYTSNGQGLKDAINAIFAGIDTSNLNAAQIALDKFCISQRTFFQNLGVQQIGACIYAASYVSNGYDRTSAFQTQQVLSLLNYQCGASFKTYSDAVALYLSAQTAQATSLAQCGTDFVNNLNSSFINNSGDHGCPAMKTFEHCVGKIYNQATANLDLAWTVCEATRRTNVVTLPACRDSTYFCDLSQL